MKKQVEARTTEWSDGSIFEWRITIRKDFHTEYTLTTMDSVVAEVVLAICDGYACKEYTEKTESWYIYKYRTWEVG